MRSFGTKNIGGGVLTIFMAGAERVKVDCLFCALSQQSFISSFQDRLDKTNVLIPVRKIDWKAALEIKALNWDDEWGFLIYSRIAEIGNLVAVEVKYHASCMKAIYKGRSNPKMWKQKELKVGGKPYEKLSYCQMTSIFCISPSIGHFIIYLSKKKKCCKRTNYNFT